MNIFVLDTDPIIAAQYHCNRHVCKMVVEATQLLANAYPLERLAQSDCPRIQSGQSRKHSHYNTPVARWVRYSIENWEWTLKYAAELSHQYTKRYNKIHFVDSFIEWCIHNPPDLPSIGLTEFVQAMPEEYKNSDAVKAYRTYYKKDKEYFAKWPDNKVPDWWVL